MRYKWLAFFLASLLFLSVGTSVGYAFINDMTSGMQYQVVPPVTQKEETEAALEAIPISNLRVELDDDMHARLFWENPSSTRCRAYFYVNASGGVSHEHSLGQLSGANARTDALMPGIEYTMRVVSDDGVELSKTITVPEGEPFREHNFRMRKNRVYYFKDASKRIWNQTFSIVSTTTVAELQERLDQDMAYAVYFDITKRKTSEPLSLLPSVYVQTPDGNVFVTECDHDPLDIPGAWDGASYYVTISDMLYEMLQETEMVSGEYHFHVYHRNMLLGSTKFTIKD